MAGNVANGFCGLLDEGVKSPDVVLERMVSLGLPVGEAAGLVRAYYASFHAIKATVSSPGSSSAGSQCSFGRKRRFPERVSSFGSLRSSVSGSWRATGLGSRSGPVDSGADVKSGITMEQVTAMQFQVGGLEVDLDEPGYCYLILIEKQYRSSVRSMLGSNPALVDLVGLPFSVFLPYSQLRGIRAQIQDGVIHLKDQLAWGVVSFVVLVRSLKCRVVEGSLAQVVASRCLDESAAYVNHKPHYVGMDVASVLPFRIQIVESLRHDPKLRFQDVCVQDLTGQGKVFVDSFVCRYDEQLRVMYVHLPGLYVEDGRDKYSSGGLDALNIMRSWLVRAMICAVVRTAQSYSIQVDADKLSLCSKSLFTPGQFQYHDCVKLFGEVADQAVYAYQVKLVQ